MWMRIPRCSFFRSRILRLSAWSRSEYLAASEWIPGAADGAARKRKVFRRSGLEPHPRLHVRPRRALPECQGRESSGTVAPEEAEALKRELIEKLTDSRDTGTGEVAIQSLYTASALYKGPYLDAAPDLIIGYADGYRTSWDAAIGRIGPNVFEDNDKAWSGDHCVDPLLVPGVLFSNRAPGRGRSGNRGYGPDRALAFWYSTAGVDGRRFGVPVHMNHGRNSTAASFSKDKMVGRCCHPRRP